MGGSNDHQPDYYAIDDWRDPAPESIIVKPRTRIFRVVGRYDNRVTVEMVNGTWGTDIHLTGPYTDTRRKFRPLSREQAISELFSPPPPL